MSAKKMIGKIMVAALVMSLVVLSIPQLTVQAAAEDYRRGPGGPDGSGWGTSADTRGAAAVPLSEAEAQGLQDAILEEYGAVNLYQAVIEQFGPVSPFTQIARSEQQHVNALVRQAEKYGVEVPANPGLETAPVFESLEEACEAGVSAEIHDGALYDELMAVTDHADLIRVYTRLQAASLDSHLPAFEACGCELCN